MKTGAQRIFAVLIACCSCAQAAVRDPFTELALEWGGLRSFLREKGVDIRVGYVSETATNVQGGDRELWRYADQWTFAAALDLETLLGLHQAQLKITVTDRNGRNLSTDAHLGSLQEVQEIYGRGQTWHWTQFSYEQKYFGGMLDWKVGRLVSGEDFADFSCEFMNLALCGPPPGNMAVNYWYNWPVSQWATRLRASFKGFGYVQLGVFEFNPSYLLTRNGLNLVDPGGASGVLVPFEIGWQPIFADRLNGSYKFGGWYNSSKASDVVENANRRPLVLDGGQPYVHNGEYGAYVNFIQQLTTRSPADSKRGLSAFFNATFADRRTSTLDSQIAAGVLYSGPFAPRYRDALGLAVGRTHVNSRIAAAETLFNTTTRGALPVRGSEYVGEIFYSVDVAPWLQLRPDIQYIYQPGGIAHSADDVIVGMRLSVNL
jgi:porin